MHRMKKAVLTAGLAVTALALSSCSQLREISSEELPSNTMAPIVPIRIIAESTATPEPEITIRDPVYSHSPMRIATDVPAGTTIPSFYHAIDLNGVNHVVYAFTGASGQTMYRVFASVDELEDEVVQNTLTGFFAAKIFLGTNDKYIIETNKDDDPLNINAEQPATYTPCPVPTRNQIRNYIRNAERAAQQYKRETERAEKAGTPLPEPTPWDGLPIMTENTPEFELPSYIKLYNRKIPYLYYYVNVYGQNEYRQYATNDGVKSGFYLSTENGGVKEGALQINTDEDFKRENIKRGRALEQPAGETKRLPVFITLNDGKLVTVYEVY